MLFTLLLALFKLLEVRDLVSNSRIDREGVGPVVDVLPLGRDLEVGRGELRRGVRGEKKAGGYEGTVDIDAVDSSQSKGGNLVNKGNERTWRFRRRG